VLGALPDRVTYVDVEFTHEELGERLAVAGYRHDLAALFIWSGVGVYVPEEAVSGVLTFAVSSRSPDTSIVFAYVFREMIEGDDSFYGAAELRRRIAKMGEPLIYGIPRGEAAKLVAQDGLRPTEHLEPEEFKRRYLTRPDASLVGEPYGFEALAHAGVVRH
jgi:O-methyltransferase involved in polyketide biosynthesis